MPAPVVVVMLFVPVTFTVPPPVAVKPQAAVLRVMSPQMLIVAPVPAMETPVPPLLPMAPESVIVPPVMPEMSTAFCGRGVLRDRAAVAEAQRAAADLEGRGGVAGDRAAGHGCSVPPRDAGERTPFTPATPSELTVPMVDAPRAWPFRSSAVLPA